MNFSWERCGQTVSRLLIVAVRKALAMQEAYHTRREGSGRKHTSPCIIY
jgi:hypothetical protein